MAKKDLRTLWITRITGIFTNKTILKSVFFNKKSRARARVGISLLIKKCCICNGFSDYVGCPDNTFSVVTVINSLSIRKALPHMAEPFFYSGDSFCVNSSRYRMLSRTVLSCSTLSNLLNSEVSSVRYSMIFFWIRILG